MLTFESKLPRVTAWSPREVTQRNADGAIIFHKSGVDAPTAWSDAAVMIAATKYFTKNETSVRAMIDRVTTTIAAWGIADGYFDEINAAIFRDDLFNAIAGQYASFNSPVYFNVGVDEIPQTAACFINAVDDTMDSILDLAKTEGMIFKHGSGSGVNLSSLRSSREPLSSGGRASGPVSFMRGYDAFAGVIHSGGKHRRSAKMTLLDVDHPDIRDFIACKVTEDRKARMLIAAGLTPSDAYASVAFQNGNNSVRISDEFMSAAAAHEPYALRSISGEEIDRVNADEVLTQIAAAAWECGDPGVQFSNTINAANPFPYLGEIRASNPCAEDLWLDYTVCNLASLNLLRFQPPRAPDFDLDLFAHVVRLFVTAQDILIDRSAYPTPRIAETTRQTRPIGLGYTNLGGWLMSQGLVYDSLQARDRARLVTRSLSLFAQQQSHNIANVKGAFPAYQGEVNNAVRNAQLTLLAPTGTISFLLDAATTGIEPAFALTTQKRCADGSLMTLVNPHVADALTALGYADDVFAEFQRTGALNVSDEHRHVFDCAAVDADGRSIAPRGHLAMLAAVQPFLSGGISKTINLPHSATPADIRALIVEAWQKGIKCLSVYRDGSKASQPLSTSTPHLTASTPMRRRLPDEREAITHKFSIGGHEGYVTVGMYADRTPGELFIVMSKEGSTLSGMMDGFATAVSLALQYGVPLDVLHDKFAHTRFEPSGWTNNKQIPMAKSVLDYIFRWLDQRFGAKTPDIATPAPTDRIESDAPMCSTCGAQMRRNGTC
jgi:ribonucleoside-diphosphate reductase alpha chain